MKKSKSSERTNPNARLTYAGTSTLALSMAQNRLTKGAKIYGRRTWGAQVTETLNDGLTLAYEVLYLIHQEIPEESCSGHNTNLPQVEQNESTSPNKTRAHTPEYFGSMYM